MKNLFIFSLTLFCAACTSNSNKVEIDGQFYGQDSKTIFLEELSPSGSQIVDSALTDKNGKFSFNISPAKEVPTFYNVRLGDTYVPLLVERGEDVEISAVGNIFYNYTIAGSTGSSLVKEFNTLLRNTTLELDSILNLYETSVDPVRTQELGYEYGQKYIQLKRNAIKFIVSNANSLASLLPLYHPKADGQYMFDQPEDYLFFKMVSDSLSAKYPQSPYAQALQRDITKVMGAMQIDSMINAKLNDRQSLPDFTMTDAKGHSQTLSSYFGKTILLDFTASESADLKILSRELMDTYDKYKSKGFVVFQVSLDNNKADWLRTVSEQRLPWISVCDAKGAASPAARLYNVQQLPTNFLIGSTGEIIGQNLYGAALELALEKALN